MNTQHIHTQNNIYDNHFSLHLLSMLRTHNITFSISRTIFTMQYCYLTSAHTFTYKGCIIIYSYYMIITLTLYWPRIHDYSDPTKTSMRRHLLYLIWKFILHDNIPLTASYNIHTHIIVHSNSPHLMKYNST